MGLNYKKVKFSHQVATLHGHVDGFERAFSTLEEMLEYVLPLLDTREVNDKS